MSRTRAFSDSEIVTIAAVAAGALGGIVVGLGRGQESALRSHRRREQIQQKAEHAIGTGRAVAQAAADVVVDEQVTRVVPAVRRAYKEAVPAAGADVSSRAASLRKRAGTQIAGGSRVALQRPRNRALLRMLGAAFGAASARRAKSNGSSSAIPEIASIGKRIVEDLLTSGEVEEPEPAVGSGTRERLAAEAASLEAGLAEAPAKIRSGAEHGLVALRSRVSTPVVRAASSTKNATQEALAALAWLSIGAAIVYFGLLSDQRREQVKSALCAAVEQARLLALDLQGYEPEM